MVDWYVAFVRTGLEDEVRLRILVRWPDMEILIPRRALRERRKGRWQNVQPTVFPGYLFFRAELTPQLYFRIRGILDVIGILKHNGQPVAVRESEMDHILKLIGPESVITFSRVRTDAGKVVVESGPLMGMEGLIVSADRRKGRVKIRLTVNGIAHTFDVGAEWINDEPSAVPAANKEAPDP